MPQKGEKMSDEQKAKISESMRAKGKQHTKAAREALAFYRQQAHQIYLLKLQMQSSDEHAEQYLGDGAFYRHSEETKAKISASLKAIGHRPGKLAQEKLAEYRLQKKRDAALKTKLRQLGIKESKNE